MGCRPDSVLGENTERFVLLLQRAQYSYVCFVPRAVCSAECGRARQPLLQSFVGCQEYLKPL